MNPVVNHDTTSIKAQLKILQNTIKTRWLFVIKYLKVVTQLYSLSGLMGLHIPSIAKGKTENKPVSTTLYNDLKLWTNVALSLDCLSSSNYFCHLPPVFSLYCCFLYCTNSIRNDDSCTSVKLAVHDCTSLLQLLSRNHPHTFPAWRR